MPDRPWAERLDRLTATLSDGGWIADSDECLAVAAHLSTVAEVAREIENTSGVGRLRGYSLISGGSASLPPPETPERSGAMADARNTSSYRVTVREIDAPEASGQAFVEIPSPVLRALGWSVGTLVEVGLLNSALVVSRAKKERSDG